MSRKLTPQFVLKKAKRRLGTKMLNLPLDDDELLEILYEDTIPTFSIYFPYEFQWKVNLGLCDIATQYCVESSGIKAYYIDLPNNMNVIECASLDYMQNSMMNYYTPPTGLMDSYDIFNNQIMQGMYESMMSFPTLIEWKEPNILIVNEPSNLMYKDVVLRLYIEHSKDFSTIKFSYLDWLVKLYVLDLKIALYEILKYTDKQDTIIQQIDLKIENWADASDRRDQLLEEWDQIFLSHRNNYIRRV